MPDNHRDPLLLAGKGIAYFIQGVMAFAAAVLVFAIPLLLFKREAINAEIVEELGSAVGAFPLVPVLGVIMLALVLVVAIFFFFDKLRRIIATVGEGDPFVPENADRLTGMAWIALGAQLVMLPLAGLALYLAKWADEVEHAEVTIDAGVSLEGIMMIIVLFILARVFRHGTQMREDLEGTV